MRIAQFESRTGVGRRALIGAFAYLTLLASCDSRPSPKDVGDGAATEDGADGVLPNAASPADSTLGGDDETSMSAMGDSQPGDADDEWLNSEAGAADCVSATGSDTYGKGSCTLTQWQACEDGDPCTDHVCEANGCHSFDNDGCDDCPRYSRGHSVGKKTKVIVRGATAAKDDVHLAVADLSDDVAGHRPMLIARSATGKLMWTHVHNSSNDSWLHDVVARADGKFWAVGSERQTKTSNHTLIVLLDPDTVTAKSWVSSEGQQSIGLHTVQPMSKDGLVAFGNTGSYAGKRSVVLWKDVAGKSTGPGLSLLMAQTTLLASATGPGGQSVWAVGVDSSTSNTSTKGYLVRASASGILAQHSVDSSKGMLVLWGVSTHSKHGVIAVGAHGGQVGVVLVGDPPYFKELSVAPSAVDGFHAVTPTDDGDLLATGWIESDGVGAAVLMKISPTNGAVKFHKKLSGKLAWLSAINRTRQGDYLLAGSFHDSDTSWMLRTSVTGSISCP